MPKPHVEHARRAAEQAREAAEAANRIKAEFLAVMSHELRTPLNTIGGYAELLDLGLRGPVTEAQRVDLGRIRRSQQQLLGLITGILNHARLEAGQVEYRADAVPLGALVEDVAALVAPQAEARRVSIASRRRPSGRRDAGVTPRPPFLRAPRLGYGRRYPTNTSRMPCTPLPRAPRRAPPPSLVGPPSAMDDPLARSLLPPFVRARRFLEHAGSLSRRGWDDAIARSLAPEARLAATRRVAALIAEHPQSRAMDALARAAQQAARDAARDRRLATDFEARAAGLVTHAAFALALREHLAPREFEVLYAPFVRGA